MEGCWEGGSNGGDGLEPSTSTGTSTCSTEIKIKRNNADIYSVQMCRAIP